MLSISVIILTYNSSSHIEKLLKSLTSRYEGQLGKEVEIIVADNSSTDNTLELAKKFKNIEILENGGNFGFAKGINLAVKHAKGENLLFINPDAVLVDGNIFNLVDKLNEDIAVVGGEVLKTNGGRELSCGKFYNLVNTFLLAVGLEEKLGVRFSPKTEKFVDFVSGGFMLVKTEVWKKLGGFDENFFMYVEDMEFCFRIKKLGKKVLFSKAATVQHVGQGSSNRAFAIINIYKGILFFHKKHMGYMSFTLVKFILLLKAASLVILGRISNNKYLYGTYSQAFSEII